MKGLAQQNKQSSFIKKGLGGVEGRQRWHPVESTSLSLKHLQHSSPFSSFRWWLQGGRPVCLPSKSVSAQRLQSCTQSWICLMMGYEYVCRLSDVLLANCNGRKGAWSAMLHGSCFLSWHIKYYSMRHKDVTVYRIFFHALSSPSSCHFKCICDISDLFCQHWSNYICCSFCCPPIYAFLPLPIRF